jgi:hypothetical protein
MFLIWGGGFIMKEYWVWVKGFFFIYWNNHVIFGHDSICVLDYAYRSVYVIFLDLASLEWNKSDLFTVLLNLVYQYFIENFCMYIHQGNCPTVFLFVVSLSNFSIKVILATQNEFRSVPSLCSLWNILKSIDVRSSLKIW